MIHIARSNDGTPIGYLRRGGGPPLLLVHGTTADHTRWFPVLPALEPHFTIFAMDRRGYGVSGDAADYRMEHEFEDVTTLIASIDVGPVDVVAHSFGAICALEAARRGARVRRLVLYEPPIPTSSGAYYTTEALEQMRGCIARDDREGALDIFYGSVVGIPPRELAMMKSLSTWPAQVSAAHTVMRELESVERYRVEPGRFENWSIPTLLLLGGESEPQYRASIEYLGAILPSSAIAVLDGQRHSAIGTAPALFSSKVLAFLLGSPSDPDRDADRRPGA